MLPKMAPLVLALLAFIATPCIYGAMGAETSAGSGFVPRKYLAEASCKEEDISILQSQDSSGGIPRYRVEIVNNCISGCAPSGIRFHCGWFSSTNVIDPKVFRRVAYDDCLVNDGKPLKNGRILSFSYSNTFKYPLSFKSASFC